MARDQRSSRQTPTCEKHSARRLLLSHTGSGPTRDGDSNWVIDVQGSRLDLTATGSGAKTGLSSLPPPPSPALALVALRSESAKVPWLSGVDTFSSVLGAG
jgi:hypothetical protein